MSTLDIRVETGGFRHYLDGEPVHAGTGLELRGLDGSWVAGRYEWSGLAGALPRFYVNVAGHEATITLTLDLELRWPVLEDR